MEISNRISTTMRPVLDFDASRMFEPGPLREVASEAIREFMQVGSLPLSALSSYAFRLLSFFPFSIRPLCYFSLLSSLSLFSRFHF